MFAVSPRFPRAAREYRWLLDRGYSETASLKLVGDRHQLGRDERTILFRGVASSRASESRRKVLALPPDLVPGLAVLVDGYNQALTVMHYLVGRPLFVGTDGLLRDAGGSHGRIPDAELFARAIGILADRLASDAPSRAEVYLDAPVAGSAGHAALFLRALAERGVEAAARLERSADAPLKAAAPADGVLVATSDSAIADALAGSAAGVAGRGARVYDAARCAIEQAFGPAPFLDLGRLADGPREAE